MKRHFMKSLMALCTGVMTLVAASSLFVSCYDDSALREDLKEFDKELNDLAGKVAAIEELQTRLDELTARVNALYTLKFKVNENNELQYSFDGGQTWNATGIVLAEECDCVPAEPCDHECPPCQYVPCDHECPEVSIVDNGETVTFKVGDAEFTVVKPQEIVFELRAGKLYFKSEGTTKVVVKSSGIEDITVISAPKGWWAEYTSEGMVEITAPDYAKTQGDYGWDENDNYYELPGECAASGYVKVHACTADGKCMVGKLAVEVVSQALSVKAYGTMAYYDIAGAYSWAPTFYYGISHRNDFEADAAVLIKAMNTNDWELLEYFDQNWGEAAVWAEVADVLGEEPALGEEYVVWALLEDYSKESYSIDDFVYAYYSPVKVEITEVAEETTPYNVTVNVEVFGTDRYVAVAMPESQLQWTSVEDIQMQMPMALAEGQYYGKLYDKPYSGSALDIAAGTSYSMTGNYSPDSDVYVFILPLDERSVEDYSSEDVYYAKFHTSALAPGGSVTLDVQQVTSYWGEVYDYEIWDYVTQEIFLDPYTQLGVSVTPSSTDWSSLYWTWMSDADYADYGAYEEDLVDYILENSFGTLPEEVKTYPLYLTQTTSPNTTLHFVAFVVDATGKYSEIAHVKATSKELVKAEYTWAEPVKTNVVDGVLKNNLTLELTPEFEEGTEPALYKYVLAQTKYYNQYEGMSDTEMAEELYFSTSSSVKTVTAEELVNGVLYVDGHSYGYPYYFAIVPIDAEGNPGTSALILEYETLFAIDEVATEGHDFDVTEPAVKILLPEEWECYLDGDFGDAAYYGYEYQDYYSKYNFYYEIAYTVNPVEGTEVCSVLVDTESYTLGADAATKAGQVWGGSLGSWNTNTTTEYYESSFRYFNNYEDEPAPALVLCVSWKDAEGNLYYKDYDLQEEMQRYADLMKEYIAGTKEIPSKPDTPATTALTVEGKQWAFDWTAMAMQFGLEGMPTRLDLGATIDTYFMLGVDYTVLSPDAPGWMAYNEGYYSVEATDATSGVIYAGMPDYNTGDMVYQPFIEYYDLTETTCTFNCPIMMIENVVATLCEENVSIIPQGVAM